MPVRLLGFKERPVLLVLSGYICYPGILYTGPGWVFLSDPWEGYLLVKKKN